jgi:transposase
MRTGISITLKPSDRRHPKTLARDRNAPHKHVWRAEIVLFSADGVGTNEIMQWTGKSKAYVWRWQERFMQEGYDGLLREKTRPSRIPRLGSIITERVVMLTQIDSPAEGTHWTSTMMAKVVDIAASSVQRIWRAHGLQPHRVKQFKLSTDPQFVGKLRDIVGLYVDPAAHAIALPLRVLLSSVRLAQNWLRRLFSEVSINQCAKTSLFWRPFRCYNILNC